MISNFNIQRVKLVSDCKATQDHWMYETEQYVYYRGHLISCTNGLWMSDNENYKVMLSMKGRYAISNVYI